MPRDSSVSLSPRKVDVQKQNVRQALEAAATSSTAHTSPAPPPSSSRSRPQAEEDRARGAAEVDRRESDFDAENEEAGRRPGGAGEQEGSFSDDDSAYDSGVDRELQETLQK